MSIRNFFTRTLVAAAALVAPLGDARALELRGGSPSGAVRVVDFGGGRALESAPDAAWFTRAVPPPEDSDFNICGSGSPAICEHAGEAELQRGSLVHARRYFRDACALNDPLACLRIANLEGEQGNWEAVAPPARKACQLGILDACRLERSLERRSRAPALFR